MVVRSLPAVATGPFVCGT
ncbi:hypothetical protein BN1708_019905 [Verticillium longisporum]|uniref:Uncharacterized protein n=1 Tax=Verticillium longisporum TaxID=100787 RepID=A0A0G4MP67_VERLO|nr:hypothetical protein BN1708_019905 [Verticillium longisporum]